MYRSVEITHNKLNDIHMENVCHCSDKIAPLLRSSLRSLLGSVE